MIMWVFLPEVRAMNMSQLARGYGLHKQSLGRWVDKFKKEFPHIKLPCWHLDGPRTATPPANAGQCYMQATRLASLISKQLGEIPFNEWPGAGKARFASVLKPIAAVVWPEKFSPNEK